MARQIQFEGKIHSFPDDATDQEIEQVLSGAEQTKQPSLLQQIEQSAPVRKAAYAASGVIKGAAVVPALPFDIARSIGSAVGVPAKYLPYGSEAIRGSLQASGITMPPSQAANEQVLERIGREIGGAAGFGAATGFRAGG